jgi:FkbM family methyltransferase
MDEQERVVMTLGCADCEALPKVANAGYIMAQDGYDLQVMHNGLRVVAGGYHGYWMAEIIRGLRGHHEPQEELIFHHLLRHVRHRSLMVELGSFWAYYSMWYLHAVPFSRALCVEPDPYNMSVGKINASLNGLTDRIEFKDACVGGAALDFHEFFCETIRKTRSLPCLDMDAIVSATRGEYIELLHVDSQGAELGLLQSMGNAATQRRLRFLVVSTHHGSISGSKTTHADCLTTVQGFGASVLIEYNVQESFSGDGLIVASFRRADEAIALPAITRNTPGRSLFPEA